jgi:hypothetical protein
MTARRGSTGKPDRAHDMMEGSGNNVALVISYSGHKSIESFRIYLHVPEQGYVLTDQRVASVGLFLTSFTGRSGTSETTEAGGKRLKIQLLYHK